MLMIAWSLTAAVVLAPQDTSAIDVHAAARAVLDSGSVWAPDVVGEATRIIIDHGSFESAASSAGVPITQTTAASDPLVRSAEYMAFGSVTQCTGTVRSRCTLIAGTIVVQARGVRVSGARSIVTVALRWLYRGSMGFVEYDVTFVGGIVASVRQVRRS